MTPWHEVDTYEAWLTAAGEARLARKLHDAEQQAWARATSEHRSATLGDVFAAAGVVSSDAMLRAFHHWWTPHTFIDPDVPDLFRGLRERGIRIGVLSNTMWSRAEHERIFERDGVLDLIDGAVYTSEIAWTKPHAEAFRAVLDLLGVDDPATAVYVGDRPFDDIYGAKSVGMRAVLVPHSVIPSAQAPIEGTPDAVIERLVDLLEIVDGWR